MQEFDLATRMNDAAAQLAALERCQALPQFTPCQFCKLGVQAMSPASNGCHSPAAKAALAAALRLMLRQSPPPYSDVAQARFTGSIAKPFCVVLSLSCAIR